MTLAMADKAHAQQTAKLFKASDADAVVAGTDLKVTGDLGLILKNCLADADAMYINDGERVSGKYGYDEKRALFNWWKALKEMEKDLKRQKKFPAICWEWKSETLSLIRSWSRKS